MLLVIGWFFLNYAFFHDPSGSCVSARYRQGVEALKGCWSSAKAAWRNPQECREGLVWKANTLIGSWWDCLLDLPHPWYHHLLPLCQFPYLLLILHRLFSVVMCVLYVLVTSLRLDSALQRMPYASPALVLITYYRITFLTTYAKCAPIYTTNVKAKQGKNLVNY